MMTSLPMQCDAPPLRRNPSPQHMAEHGTVRISAKEVAQLIGQVRVS